MEFASRFSGLLFRLLRAGQDELLVPMTSFFRYCLIALPQSILPAPYAEPEPSSSPVHSSESVKEFDSQAAIASPVSASTAASSSSEPSPVPPSPPAFSPSPDTTTTACRRTSPLPSVKESKSAVAEANYSEPSAVAEPQGSTYSSDSVIPSLYPNSKPS